MRFNTSQCRCVGWFVGRRISVSAFLNDSRTRVWPASAESHATLLPHNQTCSHYPQHLIKTDRPLLYTLTLFIHSSLRQRRHWSTMAFVKFGLKSANSIRRSISGPGQKFIPIVDLNTSFSVIRHLAFFSQKKTIKITAKSCTVVRFYLLFAGMSALFKMSTSISVPSSGKTGMPSAEA